MKICILSSGHEVSDPRVYDKEIRSLQTLYKDITFVGPHPCEIDEKHDLHILGLPPRQTSSLLRRFSPLFALYRKGLSVQADVYHCHEPDSLFIGWLIKLKLGSKLIYDCHEYHPESFAERFPAFMRKLMTKCITNFEKMLARKTDYVFTVCEELVNKFKNWGCRVDLIANYPSKHAYTPSAYKSDVKQGIWVGGMNQERGLLEIVKACAILKQKGIIINLLFIGWGNQTYIAKLEAEIVENDLSQQVKIVGKMPTEQVFQHLQKADFGLLMDYPLSRNMNTIALKMYEYMAAAIPVVANDFPATRKLVEAHQLGELVDPLSPVDIARGIENLYNEPFNAFNMGKNGRIAYEMHYNWDVMEKTLFQAYQTLESNPLPKNMTQGQAYL
ncbi:glycosyltransferase family 4 protein [Paenibacillus sp. KN14-4R]|uniref:glycosyltransferase family 4 protein n=1 Tax=Paenibacillus sp. KN14-4R TaxID=3445773 RepID=UPI003FA1160F